MLRIYDSNAVDLIFLTIPITEGRLDPFFSIEIDGDAFEVTKGIDGSLTRIAKHETLAKGTISLKGSSPHNTVLSAIHKGDIISTSGAGVGVLYLHDNNGVTLITSARAWIVKEPAKTFGTDNGDMQWPFACEILPGTMILGGNESS